MSFVVPAAASIIGDVKRSWVSKVLLIFLLLFAIGGGFQSCFFGVMHLFFNSGFRDVTHDSSFGDFSPVIGKWKLKTKARIVEIERTKELYLELGDAPKPDPRFEVPGFTSGSKDLAALPVGTEISIDELLYRETFETNYLDATGSLTAGPYAGRQLRLAGGLFDSNILSRAAISRGQPGVRGTKWAVAADKLER